MSQNKFNHPDGLIVGSRKFSIEPVKNPANQLLKPHFGQDYQLPNKGVATPVSAPAYGHVIDVGRAVTSEDGKGANGGRGNYITIEYTDANGEPYARVTDMHLADQSSLHKNDLVTPGSIIGYVGSTGNSTGPHLHRQISVPEGSGSWKKIDPITFEPPGNYLDFSHQYAENSSGNTYYKFQVAENGSDAFANKLTGYEGSDKGQYADSGSHWGMYQMGKSSLVATKYMSADGSFTGKDGITSIREFLANAGVQHKAFGEYLDVLRDELKANGAWNLIGKEVNGTVVTESGLLGAAWLGGAGGVKQYLVDGIDTADKNGATVSGRLKAFAGFDLAAQQASPDAAFSRTPYPGDGTVTHNSDQSISYSKTATSDAPDGSYSKGDWVSSTYDKDDVPLNRVVWHKESGQTNLTEYNGDGTVTSCQWDRAGKLLTRITYDRETGKLVGDFILNGRQYHADGTLVPENASNEQPAAVDPQQIPPIPAEPLPKNVVSAGLEQEFANVSYGLGRNIGGLSLGALGFAPTTDPQQLIRQFTEQGYTVTQDGDSIVATRGDEYVVAGNGYMEMGNGEQYKRMEKVGDAWVISDSERGEVVRISPAGGGRLAVSANNVTTEVVPDINPDTQAVGFKTLDGRPFPLQDVLTFKPLTSIGSDVSEFAWDGWEFRPVANQTYLVDGKNYQLNNQGNLERSLIGGYKEIVDPGGNHWLYSANGERTPIPKGFGLTFNDAGDVFVAPLFKPEEIKPQPPETTLGLTDAQWQQVGMYASAVQSGLSLFQALRADNELGTVISGVNLANNLSVLAGNGPLLSSSGTLNGALGLAGVLQALGNTDDPLSLVQGSLSLATQAAALYSNMAMEQAWSFVDAGSFDAAFDMMEAAESASAISSSLGTVLPGLNLMMAFQSGNPFSIAAAALNFIPGVGQIASIVVSIVGSLLGDFLGGDEWEPPPLPPTGEAHFVRNADGSIGIEVSGANGGEAILNARMHEVLADLQSQAQGAGLELVPERLPSLGLYSWPSYSENCVSNFVYTLKLADPNTGEEKLLASPRADILETFTQATGYAEGAVEHWEAAQIEAKRQAGDGHFAETEGQYAHRMDEASPSHQPSTARGEGVVSAIVVDIEGNGIQKLSLPPLVGKTLTDLLTDHIARFDADDDGYKEATEWVAPTDALLALDRNQDGAIGNARELLSGQNIATSQRGGELLGWLDANHDGQLTQADPAFSALTFWLDLNGDGASEVRELFSLGDAGVESIDLASQGVHFTDGSSLHLQEVQLQHEQDGIRLSQDAAGNTHISAENGLDGQGTDADLSYVTQADDLTQLQQLLQPETLTPEETAQLRALAAYYGIDPDDPQALAALKTPTPGASRAILTLDDEDIDSDGEGGTPSQREVRRILQAATNDSSQLFAGASAGLMALAVGAGPVKTAEAAQSDVPSAETEANLVHPVDPPIVIDRATPLILAADSGAAVSAFLPANPAGGGGAVPVVTFSTGASPTGDAATPSTVSYIPPADPLVASVDKMGAASVPLAASATVVSFETSQPNDSAPLPQNFAPTLGADRFRLDEDTGLELTAAQLLANDADIDQVRDDDVLTLLSVFNPRHGAVELLAGGRIRFLPEANFNGEAGFDYTVADGAGNIAVQSVTLDITPVDDVPGSGTLNVTGSEDLTLLLTEGRLLGAVYDPDVALNGDVLHVTAVQPGPDTHGALTLEADGSVRFEPDANYQGPASFTYTVTDSTGRATTATASLTLLAVNDLPVVQGETADTLEDTAIAFTQGDLLANDNDVDVTTEGQTLAVSVVGNAVHGQVGMNADGSVIFTPDADFHGEASFDYTVADGAGGAVQATMRVRVEAVNDLPVTQGERVAGLEDTGLLINPAALLANDRDVDTVTDGQVLSIAAVGNARHGAVSLTAEGWVQFVPDADFHGEASFDYSVSDGAGGQTLATALVDIAGVNDAPQVFNETVTGGVEDADLLIDPALLLANDRDVDIVYGDGDVLQVVSVSNPLGGTVRLGEGLIRFTPDANFNGTARFDYVVADGKGGQTMGVASVVFEAINDAPVGVGESMDINEDDIAFIPQRTLLANEIDPDIATNGDSLRIVSVSNAVLGTVVLAENGEVVFTPTADAYGTAGFDYELEDSVGARTTAHATLNVAPVNDAPVAVGETFAGGVEDTVLLIPLSAFLQNDWDVEGEPIHLDGIVAASGGTATIDWANQRVVFTPTANFYGIASFDYQLSDGQGGVSTARMNVEVANVQDAPIAGADGITVLEDGGAVDYNQSWATIIQASALLANDHDADGDPLSIGWVGNAGNCSVSLQADGSIRFTSPQNYSGSAWFQYEVADGHGNSAYQSVSVNVQAVNDKPVIEALESGRAVFGYAYDSSVIGSDGNPTLQPVYDEAKAISLTSRTSVWNWNGLCDQNGNSISISYYSSGDLRPYSIEYGANQGRIIAYDPDGPAGGLQYSITSNPLHGTAYMGYDCTVMNAIAGVPSVTVFPSSEPNEWAFKSGVYDPYQGTSPFTARVTDGGGAYAEVTLNPYHYGSSASGGGGGCPIVLDLDGDGIELTSVDDSQVFMDLNGDGWKEKLGWTAADDALLAFDADGDGLISKLEEFSFVGYLEGAKTDLEGLRAFDTDGDGWLTDKDKDWNRFGVWHDRNGNGLTDEGEFSSLAAKGITAIGLTSDGNLRLEQGNAVFGEAQYLTADGASHIVGDVGFRAVAADSPGGAVYSPPETSSSFPSPLPDSAELLRLAQQFVSDCAGSLAMPPSELDIPPSSPPAETILAANPLAPMPEVEVAA